MVARGARHGQDRTCSQSPAPLEESSQESHPERVPEGSRAMEACKSCHIVFSTGQVWVTPRSGTPSGVPFLGAIVSRGAGPASASDLLRARTPGYHL